MGEQPDRVALDRIIEEWSSDQTLSTRRLASEVAAVLRSLSPESLAISERIACVTMSTPLAEPAAITFGALANYFDAIGQGVTPPVIATTTGSAPASTVILLRTWIAIPVKEATKRASFVAGFALPANDSHIAAMVANARPIASHAEPPLPSGSEPGYLDMRQAQQRQEGERSAAAQLEAMQIAAQRAEQKAEHERAKNAVIESQLQRYQSEIELIHLEAIEERRQRTILTEQLRQHAGIIEFMNPDNPLSPEEGRRMVAAWDELTESGTMDPVAENGIGIGELARRWWRDRFGEPAGIVVKHLQWALTWPARKKGGMVAKRQCEKG